MKAFAVAVFLAGLALGVAYPEIAGRGTRLGSYDLRENQWVWSTSVQLEIRKSTRLNSSHIQKSRMPSSA